MSDKVAAAIAMALREAAAGMTTAQLRAELRYMVLMFEPEAFGSAPNEAVTRRRCATPV